MPSCGTILALRRAGDRGREELLGVTLREGHEVGDLLSLQCLDLQELAGLHLDRLPLPGADVTRPDRRFLTQQVAHSWVLLLAGYLVATPVSLRLCSVRLGLSQRRRVPASPIEAPRDRARQTAMYHAARIASTAERSARAAMTGIMEGYDGALSQLRYAWPGQARNSAPRAAFDSLATRATVSQPRAYRHDCRRTDDEPGSSPAP